MSNDTMTHNSAFEALDALALDALDPAEREAVAAHVEHCAECRSELASLRAASAELSLVVRPIQVSPVKRDRIRSRLLARAAGDRQENADMSVEPTIAPKYEVLIPTYPHVERRASMTRHWMTSTSSWIAMAATIIAVASIASLLQVTSERDTLAAQVQSATTDRASGSTLVDSLQNIIGSKDRMIANLVGPQVAVVSLASSSAPSPNGRMFWDQGVNQWTFVAHNIPRPRVGRAYQLWLLTASQKISAGMFMPPAERRRDDADALRPAQGCAHGSCGDGRTRRGESAANIRPVHRRPEGGQPVASEAAIRRREADGDRPSAFRISAMAIRGCGSR